MGKLAKLKNKLKDKKPAGKAPAKAKEQAWQDDLERELAGLGLCVRRCAADGSCFFRACSCQAWGDESRHMALRQAVVSFMESHRGDFEPYMEHDEAFESYCKRMRKDGTWAGQQEQVAVARLHGVELKIFQLGKPCWTIHPDFPEVPKDAPAWLLSYHDGEHYNSVHPAEAREGGAAPAAPPGWSAEQVRDVSLGTGCEDEVAVRAALSEARGSREQAARLPQAIELLVARLAAESEAAEAAEAVPALAAAEPVEQAAADPMQLLAPGSALPQQPQASEAAAAPALAAVAPDAAAAVSALAPEAVSEALPVAAAERRGRGERPPARNRPCACGSGRRYKNCCGAAAAAAARRAAAAPAAAPAAGLPAQIESLYV